MPTPRPLTESIVSSLLPPRAAATHKKKAVVLLVAGSSQYLGAALLCARGAYRAGAGLVRLVLPEPLAPWAMQSLPELVVHGLGPGPLGLDQAAAIQALASDAQAIAVGPGLGRDPGTQKLVARLWRSLPQPAVFDADALFALDMDQAPGGPRVLTPHEGELKKLLGPEALAQGRQEAALNLARRGRCVGLLKGPETLVATAEGALSVNTTGSPVLATAGTGDVLAGAIAGLLAQGAKPYDAACLGAWIHGRAGDLWAGRHGQRGLLAGDLADGLPDALKSIGA
jgi:hydroxyethylthiazole kinase-like uncharacterized protein yjeF